jgi:energy-coupling factor transporter ATP-binding protein EcfA2
VISLKEVSFSYQGEKALNGVNLEIAAGEQVVLIGANGSGKSTLALVVKGLLIPSEGMVTIDGISTAEAAPAKIGMVFQNPEDQLVAATVEREIAFGLENIGLQREEMFTRVEETISVFGLEGLRHRPPHLLSGGQMQKVALASVWVMKPDFLILDEPTSLLDPAARREFLDIVRRLPDTTGVLFITQYPRETLDFKRLLVLSQGRIFFDGRPEEFFQNEKLIQTAGMEPPVRFRLKKLLPEN